MIKAYVWLKKNRLMKKVKLYQLLLSLTFDAVSLFYLLALVGYFAYSWIQVGEIPPFGRQIIDAVALFFHDVQNMQQVFLFLPLVYIARSLKHPGVLFSSSEQLLSLLPYARKKLWLLAYIERTVQACFILALVACCIYFLVPVRLLPLVLFAVGIWLMIGLLLFVQWKLFQSGFLWKVAILLVLSLLSGVYVALKHQAVYFLYVTVVFALMVYSIARIFTHIDWQKVVNASDFLVWNMPLISQATKIKIKRDKQLALLYRFKFWKAEFPYQIEHAYHRLWVIYVEKQIGHILQMTFALLLLLAVVSYFRPFYFGMALGLAIFIETSFLMALFKDRLTFDLLSVLPWDMKALRKSFAFVAMLLSFVLLVPASVYAYVYLKQWSIFYLVLAILTFIIFLNVKLDRQFHVWDRSHPYAQNMEVLAYVLVFVVMFSVVFQWGMLLGYVLCAMYFYKMMRHRAVSQ